jgi:hypothetical protein
MEGVSSLAIQSGEEANKLLVYKTSGMLDHESSLTDA